MVNYLPYVVGLSYLEYILVILAFQLCSYFCSRRNGAGTCCRENQQPESGVFEAEDGRGDAHSITSISRHPTPRSSQFNINFEKTFTCSVAPSANLLLLFTRLVGFGYVVSVSVIYNYVKYPYTTWYYFTIWNAQLISVYFLLALTCSVIGVVHGGTGGSDRAVHANGPTWSQRVNVLGRVIHVLFEVCGGTACFITVVSFVALNPEFSFSNGSDHFATLVFMLVELAFNDMYVRFDHFQLNVTWDLMYLTFIWPVVALGVIARWPYFFLDVQSLGSLSLATHTALLVLSFVFYSVFYGVSELKFAVRAAACCGGDAGVGGADGEEGVALSPVRTPSGRQDVDDTGAGVALSATGTVGGLRSPSPVV